MDKKNLESRLSDLARDFGFLMPDGSFPPENYFAPLFATPHRRQLWEMILNKLESKEKVRKIRKQILLASLKANGSSNDFIMNARNSGVGRKIELWNKKQILEKKILEKRKQVNELHSDIYKRAQSVQLDVCKIAEVEKGCADVREKIFLSKLMIDKYKSDVQDYREQLTKLKSYGIVNELYPSNFSEQEILELCERAEDLELRNIGANDLGSDEARKVANEISEKVADKTVEKQLWELIISRKKNNFSKYSALSDEHLLGNHTCLGDEDTPDAASIQSSMEEQFMLETIENSLYAILNKRNEEEENVKLNDVLSEIERIMFNKSTGLSASEDMSYLCPNEMGDSLTGRNEKMAKLTKSLSQFGFKKRREFLNREMDRINESNKKREHWLMDKKNAQIQMQKTLETAESLQEEAKRLISAQRASVQCIMKSHLELESFVKHMNERFGVRDIFNCLRRSSGEIMKLNEMKFQLFNEMPMDSFRRIHMSPGKELYECESLTHCLDHYGGELRELFTSTLLSPFDRPESLIGTLEKRKEFVSHVNAAIVKNKRDAGDCRDRLSEEKDTGGSSDVMEKNFKETNRILSRICSQGKALDGQRELIQKILKCWIEQSYRLIVPEDITVDGLTLRQYEEKYKMALSEFKYRSGVNQSFAVNRN